MTLFFFFVISFDSFAAFGRLEYTSDNYILWYAHNTWTLQYKSICQIKFILIRLFFI